MPYFNPTEMFSIELNCECDTANSGVVSDVTSKFVPPGVFEELLGNVLRSSLWEEIFGEFPETSGCISLSC